MCSTIDIAGHRAEAGSAAARLLATATRTGCRLAGVTPDCATCAETTATLLDGVAYIAGYLGPVCATCAGDGHHALPRAGDRQRLPPYQLGSAWNRRLRTGKPGN